MCADMKVDQAALDLLGVTEAEFLELQKTKQLENWIENRPEVFTSIDYLYAYIFIKIREVKGCNQKSMAMLYNILPSTYNKIENGQQKISINLLNSFLTSLGLTLQQFGRIDYSLRSLINKTGGSVVVFDPLTTKANEKNIERLFTPISLFDEKLDFKNSRLFFELPEIVTNGELTSQLDTEESFTNLMSFAILEAEAEVASTVNDCLKNYLLQTYSMNEIFKDIKRNNID